MVSFRPGPAHGAQPPPSPEFTPPPARGRVFAASRAVRTTDAAPDGRLRFDAFARYLQDVAEDDVADAGWAAPYDWMARRCVVTVRGYPRRGERVRLRTFCTGTGPRWAERTTTLSGAGGDLMQATALWVAIGRDTGAPTELGEGFHRHYGEATGGRQVSSRLSLPGPAALPPPGQPWPLRASDFDPAGHVNNTVHWAAVEDVLLSLDWLPASAELEYHRPILPGNSPCLLASHGDGYASLWLCDGGQRLASARMAPAAPPGNRPRHGPGRHG